MNKLNNTNKYKLVLSLGTIGILTILVLSLASFPTSADARNNNSGFTYGVYTVDIPESGNTSGGYTYSDSYYQSSNNTTTAPASNTNPVPVIGSINPGSSNIGVGIKTITITGSGFIPDSVARANGSNRPTTFVDNSHLLMQITGDDTYKYLSNGGFFITVFNKSPGGGYSNGVFFTIKRTGASATINTGTPNNVNNSDYTNFTDSENGNGAENNSSDLASNAIFGSGSIFPSNLIQWILVAILVLVIVILVRKISSAEKNYHASPLKHD